MAGVLAFHTKGTSAIFLCGFAIVFGALILRSRPSIVFWRNALIASLLADGILGGYFVRNLETFGTPFGPSSYQTMTKEPSWRSATLNAVRDIASNFAIPKAPTIRNDIAQFVSWTRKRLGISQAQDDADYALSPQQDADYTRYHFVVLSPVHEDGGSNTVHTLIVMGAATIFLFLAISSRKWWHQSGPLRTYLLATLMSMLAFFVLLRWQPWIVRLELGGFMIIIPPVALLLSELPLMSLIFAIAVLSLQSSVFIFGNASRPLFGPHSVVTASAVDILFANRPYLTRDYVHLADLLVQSRPKRVGLRTKVFDSWEFPIWYLLREKLSGQEMPIIVHETEGTNFDHAADFVVYIDTTHRIQS